MPNSKVNMVINPAVMKNFEEDMIRNAKDDQVAVESCNAMDAMLRKLNETYHPSITLGEIAVRVNDVRHNAMERLANVLIEEPAKVVKRRKKRKYTRRSLSPSASMNVPAKTKRAYKKRTKKHATKKS